jgi:hypothetical protein
MLILILCQKLDEAGVGVEEETTGVVGAVGDGKVGVPRSKRLRVSMRLQTVKDFVFRE